MIRIVLGTLAGLVIGGMAISAGQMLLHLLFPMPGLDVSDPASIKAAIQAAPLAAKLGLIAGYGAGAFFGAVVGSMIGRSMWPGWIITALLMFAAVSNFLTLPHPVWMMVASMATLLGFGWLGAWIGGRRRPT